MTRACSAANTATWTPRPVKGAADRRIHSAMRTVTGAGGKLFLGGPTLRYRGGERNEGHRQAGAIELQSAFRMRRTAFVLPADEEVAPGSQRPHLAVHVDVRV